MKKDKIIGCITIATVLLIVVYVAFAMWQNEKRARNTVHVYFYEMGSLQNEDIVTVMGLRIGKVASIKRAGGKALVEIDLDEPRIFRKDTKFTNVNPNIMGSRSITVELGTDGEVVPEDYIFEGHFEPGLAEVLALSDAIRGQVSAFIEFIHFLHKGDENSPSLQKKIEDIMETCEDLVNTLSVTVNSVEGMAMGAINKVSNYAEQISDASNKINTALDTIRVQAQDGIVTAEKVVSDIKNTLASLDRILTEFENSPVTAAILEKKDIVDDLQNLRESLNAFIHNIDKQGIVIYDENGKRKSMISLKNLHLIRETARSKAKKRAEEEAKMQTD